MARYPAQHKMTVTVGEASYTVRYYPGYAGRYSGPNPEPPEPAEIEVLEVDGVEPADSWELNEELENAIIDACESKLDAELEAAYDGPPENYGEPVESVQERTERLLKDQP